VEGKLYTSPVLAGDLILLPLTDGDILLVALTTSGAQSWAFTPQD